MELAKQVLNLELAKRLKELGVKSESLYRWNKLDEFNWQVSALKESYFEEHFPDSERYQAYSVAELGEMLPYSIDDGINFYYPTYTKHPKYYRIELLSDGEKMLKSFVGDTEADVRAKTLIHLLENELMKNE